MSRDEELENIRERLKDVIVNFCNKLGCGKCGLEYGNGDCSATDLQHKELKIIMDEA